MKTTIEKAKQSGLLQYHEILGSELPIYTFIPSQHYQKKEITGDNALRAYTAAYLKVKVDDQYFYEPMFKL